MKMPKELLDNPYSYICNYYEELYPHIGKKVWSIVSLMPCSLIMPKIPDKKKKIKQKINLILIGNPGIGKTSLAEEFEKMAYNPLFTEHITSARLKWELKDKEKVTLITSDIAQSFSNDELVKFLEGLLGDEGAISRETMKNIKEQGRKKIEGVAFLSGTFENMPNERIRDGLLLRACPLVITHSVDQHEDILTLVNEGVGEEERNEDIPHIINYYQNLREIQEGNHPEVKPIEGYVIPKEFKQEILDFIKPKVNLTFEEFGIEGTRQLHEAYRFMCAHAFLNIFNRKIKDNKIIIEEKDLKVSKYLINEEIKTIFQIISILSELNQRGIKTYKQLREWQEKEGMKGKRLDKNKEYIMRSLIKK